MGKHTTRSKLAAVVAGAALVLAACGGDGDGATPGTGQDEGQRGGTLYFLSQAEQILHLDPQRNYTGEDLAFASAYLHRTLTQYTYSEDEDTAGELVADLATDTGTPDDDGRVWRFTLRDGPLWEDGQPVTCEDVKYGVSRTFAQDVITDGPTYAISLLDGVENYRGPYDEGADNDVAAFDNAVSCDGNEVTFRLNAPMSDFNYAVTLLSFAPVREDADTGEQYDQRPLSNGPYKIETNDSGRQLVLVRNENWSEDHDDLRPAYPDRIVYQFGLDPSVIDQRLIADSGDDQYALGLGLQPASLATVFADDPRFQDRRFDGYDPYVRYFAINTELVPNLQHRQAIAVAWPRAEWLTIAGGDFAGDLADGVIKPNLAADYEESGMWTDLLGRDIPDNGDPEYARQLIEESGEPMPTLTIDYPQTPTNDRSVGALVTAFESAGITVRPNPLEPGSYYGFVLDPSRQGHLNSAGWGPDWLNASTVIPELFGSNGGFNLSRWSEFDAQIEDARTTADRDEQAEKWKDLNRQAMAQVLVVPTRFGKAQRLWGSRVGGAYLWAPYGSYPYAQLYVRQ
jgi:peptide/nickel transport system substrate-binding protein